MGLENLDCYQCGKRGHVIAECPELFPPNSEAEHLARIATYVERWIDFKITDFEKRRLITAENEMWKQVKAEKAANRVRSST